MKFHVLWLSFFVCTLINADMTNSQRRLLRNHVTKIKKAVDVLEDDLAETRKKHAEASLLHQRFKEKLENTSSMWEQGVIKTKIAYYARSVKKLNKEIRKQTLRLVICYCVLDAFEERNLSKKERRLAEEYIPDIKQHISWAQEQEENARRRKQKAYSRLHKIPSEIVKTKETLSRLRKKLDILEYKKSWSNLTERSTLQGKIAIYNGNLGKLSAEQLVQEKIVSDSHVEMESMSFERVEAEVALQQLEH